MNVRFQRKTQLLLQLGSDLTEFNTFHKFIMKKWLTVCLSKIVFGPIVLLPFTAISHVESWIILIYGHADLNLTSAILDDCMEMEQAESSEDFNIVTQVDLNTKTL